jgi:hypothetical protein
MKETSSKKRTTHVISEDATARSRIVKRNTVNVSRVGSNALSCANVKNAKTILEKRRKVTVLIKAACSTLTTIIATKPTSIIAVDLKYSLPNLSKLTITEPSLTIETERITRRIRISSKDQW